MSDRTACRQALPNVPPSRSLTQHAYAHLNSSCTSLLYLTPAARQSAMRRCGCSPPSQCGASAGVRTSAQHRCRPSCSCSMGVLAAKWRDRAEASAHAHVLPDRQLEAPLTVADLSKSLQCISCAISFPWSAGAVRPPVCGALCGHAHRPDQHPLHRWWVMERLWLRTQMRQQRPMYARLLFGK